MKYILITILFLFAGQMAFATSVKYASSPNGLQYWMGLSTDPKPSPTSTPLIPIGSTYIETNTKQQYTVNDSGAWVSLPQLVHLTTLAACEDQTNTVCKTETQMSGVPCSAATADTQCKATSGFVNTVTFSQASLAAPVAGVVTIYDSATEAGTVIWSGYFSVAVLVPFTITLNRVAATGIYLGYDATLTGVKTSVSYR